MSASEVDGLLGTTLGRFVLLRMLGEGGMGVVYGARQTDPIERNVAIKVLCHDAITPEALQTVIYLTTGRQKHLMAAAKRAGADKATRERMLQYPDKKGTRRGLVRHSDGHTAHIHVRFKCADNETRCENN